MPSNILQGDSDLHTPLVLSMWLGPCEAMLRNDDICRPHFSRLRPQFFTNPCSFKPTFVLPGGPPHSSAPTAAIVIERPSSVSPVPVPPNLSRILTPSQREVLLLEKQDRLKMKRKVLAATQKMDQLDEQVTSVMCSFLSVVTTQKGGLFSAHLEAWLLAPEICYT